MKSNKNWDLNQTDQYFVSISICFIVKLLIHNLTGSLHKNLKDQRPQPPPLTTDNQQPPPTLDKNYTASNSESYVFYCDCSSFKNQCFFPASSYPIFYRDKNSVKTWGILTRESLTKEKYIFYLLFITQSTHLILWILARQIRSRLASTQRSKEKSLLVVWNILICPNLEWAIIHFHITLILPTIHA